MKQFIIFAVLVLQCGVATAGFPPSWPDYSSEVHFGSYAPLLARDYGQTFSYEAGSSPFGYLSGLYGVKGFAYQPPYSDGTPSSYLGPSLYQTEGYLLYKFTTGFNVGEAVLSANVRQYSTDCYVKIDVSPNGVDWTRICDSKTLMYYDPYDISSIVHDSTDIWVMVKLYDTFDKVVPGRGEKIKYAGAQFAYESYTPSFAVNAVAVPEPNGYILMGIGLILMIAGFKLMKGK